MSREGTAPTKLASSDTLACELSCLPLMNLLQTRLGELSSLPSEHGVPSTTKPATDVNPPDEVQEDSDGQLTSP